MYLQKEIRQNISEALSTHPESIAERIQEVNVVLSSLLRARMNEYVTNYNNANSDVCDLDSFIKNQEAILYTLLKIEQLRGDFYELYLQEFSHIPIVAMVE